MPMSVFLYTSMPDMMPRDKVCISPYPYHGVISVGVGRHRQSWRCRAASLALDQAGCRLRLGAGELDNVGDHGTLILVERAKKWKA